MTFFLHEPWLIALMALVIGLLWLQRAKGWRWRAGSVCLLLLALAGPEIQQAGGPLVVLLDLSESVGSHALEAWQQTPARLQSSSVLIGFAGRAERGNSVKSLQSRITALDSTETDVRAALELAAAQNPGRVLLISDGVASRGQLELPQREGVVVDVLPVAQQDNVSIQLMAPSKATPGQRLRAGLILESSVAAQAEVTVTLDSEPIGVYPQQLTPGQHVIPFELTIPFSSVSSESHLLVEAALTVSTAQPTIDDTVTHRIHLEEMQPLWVMNDPALEALLRRHNIPTRSLTPDDITIDLEADALVLRAGAEAFTTGQVERLTQFVRAGGGLLMTGGPDSLGLGHWYRTPLEKVLPVNTEIKDDVALPQVALVMVMDRSNSMNNEEPSKLELAKAGALAVIDLAYQEDILGLITFSDTARWVFRPRKATSSGKRIMRDALLDISADGSTFLAEAYHEAINALETTPAGLKHIIVLSDGQLQDGGGIFRGVGGVAFEQVAAQALEQGGITTSTIAIGQSADARLESIARAGGGRYYRTLNASTLPRIFTGEALTISKNPVEQGNWQPTAYAHPLMPDIAAPLPNLYAYISSEAKPQSEALIGVADAPLLQLGRSELGRTAVLTTDLNNPEWAAAFGQWEGLAPILATLVRWLATRPQVYSVSVTPGTTEVGVSVDAVREGRYLEDESLSVRYEGVTQALEQVAPGRYEATLPIQARGSDAIILKEGREIARTTVITPEAELRRDDTRSQLRRLAEQSGGTLLEDLQAYDPVKQPQRLSVAWLFVLLGLLIFIAEMLWRRFFPT